MPSLADQGVVARLKAKQKSRLNGPTLLPGIDGRNAWVRRARTVIREHLSDIPEPSAGERSIIRRAGVLTVELERLEAQFALADATDPEAVDLYARVAGNLRRLLEAVGLQRRTRDVTPDPLEYAREHSEAANG
jgi:hypothetical protein